ncbi:MAG: DNA translocase FtsK 4TM domain-containing protein [Anaerolineales bacterium]
MPERRSRRSKKQVKNNKKPSSRSSELLWRVVERVMVYAEDLGAVVLGALALISLLAVFGLTSGRIVSPWADLLRRWLGWGAISVPLALAGGVLALFRRRVGGILPVVWRGVIALELALFGLLGMSSVLRGTSLPLAQQGAAGGLIGWGLATFLENLLGSWGRAIVLSLVAGSGIGYFLWLMVRRLARWDGLSGFRDKVRSFKLPPEASDATPPIVPKVKPERITSIDRLPKKYRKRFELPERPEEREAPAIQRDAHLPPIEIFDEDSWDSVSAKEINLAAGLIEKTLADFGLNVRVAGFRTGPTVTQFAVEPGYAQAESAGGKVRKQKVRVSQIAALANDLALALAAPRLRIEAPVPGKGYVGIEVPNKRAALVHLRPILQSEAFQSIDSPLAIALGTDVSGAAVAVDLAELPHLLIAGTTGSGKSVCITALASCLVANNTPQDLRLVLIDPKMVELVRFNGLPHLLGRVESELQRIVGVLRWCTIEMDRRFRLLEQSRSRDIDAYNRRARRRKTVEQLPRIVVMIDELADLMMMTPEQTEKTLVRLAQMARATGIHLVVATQRPSTDIVTGLIKANFPARIAFAVASGVDSRVILDAPGAESLLGRGDMLFMSPDAAAPIRLQGVFVKDLEIEGLVNYWQQAAAEEGSQDPEPAAWEDLISRQKALADRDEILERAIELVKGAGRASASMLQRRMRIGYPRAARLMDELEELGLVGEAQKGGRTRKVIQDDIQHIGSAERDE